MTKDSLDQLVEAALKPHARHYNFDREGYPCPINICAKWRTRHSIKCQEWYGELDDNIKCTCGADEHNQKIKALVT